jgi:hypothetical protein
LRISPILFVPLSSVWYVSLISNDQLIVKEAWNVGTEKGSESRLPRAIDRQTKQRFRLRDEKSQITPISQPFPLYSLSLSLFLLSRYGCFNGGRMAIPTDIDIPLRLICHFQRKTPDRNVCPYVSLVPLNLFVHRNPCGNTRRLRRHSVHM